ncbi:MAG: CvpA family protein [Pseudomonadota bacterium]
MNLLDILIIIILLFCLIRGLFRGFVLELSSIIGVLAGVYGASTYYPAAAQILSKWITDAAYRNIISLILVFICIFMAISLLGRLIKIILKIAFMGWFDRLFGAGFGVFKGCLIASVLLFAFTTFLPKGTSIIQTSRLSPYISIISGNISKLVSHDMKRSFITNIDGAKTSGKAKTTH